MPLSETDRRGTAFLAVVAAASLSLLFLDCKSPTKKAPPPAADAGAAAAEATSHLFAGEDVARFVHWNRGGDVLGVSARSVWRLPGGVLGPGARIVSEPESDSLHLVSVLDTQAGADRWLLGGGGFVSQRDPVTLAEIRRIRVEGDVTHIEIAPGGPIAAVTSCANGCRTYRLELASGAITELSRSYGEHVAISPSGAYIALATPSNEVNVYAGIDPSPAATLALEGFSAAYTFTSNDTLLAAAGKKLGRWSPGDAKPTLSALPGTEDGWSMTADPREGRIIASIPYASKLALYDGTRLRTLALTDFACAEAVYALDDPSAIECPQSGQRIDEAGIVKDTPLGHVVAVSTKHLLRVAGEGCEVAERGPGGRILAWNSDLCGASFSPDGSRLSWIDATGAVRVHALAESGEPARAPGNRVLPGGSYEGGTYSARFDRAAMSFATATAGGDAGAAPQPAFLRIELNETSQYRGVLGLSSEGYFGWQNNRIVGVDRSGKARVMAADPRVGLHGGMATHVWHASERAAVSNAYGEPERKALFCRFDASCTELELGPAQEVEGYEAPWVLTTTTTDPDAPNQSVYYLRHDDAREPLRRVIAGHACSPALLLEGGNQLACPSDGKVLRFDTRSGEALGEPLLLPLTSPGGPVTHGGRSRRALFTKNQAPPTIVGHTDRTVMLRVSSWTTEAVHLQERALPPLANDAGAPAPESASVAALADTFAVVRHTGGHVRIGGDVARAERLLACRQGEELLPWSTCRERSMSP